MCVQVWAPGAVALLQAFSHAPTLATEPEYREELKSVGDEKQLLKVPLHVTEPAFTVQSSTKRSLTCERDPLPSVGLMLVADELSVQAGVTSGSTGVVVLPDW